MPAVQSRERYLLPAANTFHPYVFSLHWEHLPAPLVCVCVIRNDLILYQKENEELLLLTFLTVFWDVMKWKHVSGYIQNVSELLPFASPDPFPALPYLLCACGINIIVTEFGYGCTNNDQKRLFLFHLASSLGVR